LVIGYWEMGNGFSNSSSSSTNGSDNKISSWGKK
jgi:hypothetical protein